MAPISSYHCHHSKRLRQTFSYSWHSYNKDERANTGNFLTKWCSFIPPYKVSLTALLLFFAFFFLSLSLSLSLSLVFKGSNYISKAMVNWIITKWVGREHPLIAIRIATFWEINGTVGDRKVMRLSGVSYRAAKVQIICNWSWNAPVLLLSAYLEWWQRLSVSAQIRLRLCSTIRHSV